MMSIGPIPFKISFLILIITYFNYNKSEKISDVIYFKNNILILLFLGVVGEIFLSIYDLNSDHNNAINANLIFIFSIFSFSLGRRLRNKFEFKYLVYILYVSIFINFVFIIFKSSLPYWLTNFYYTESSLPFFYDDLESVLDAFRPIGLFGNPNQSSFMITIILLFILLAIKNKLYKIDNLITKISIIILPLLLIIAFGSRNQFLSMIIYGLVSLNLFYNIKSWKFLIAIIPSSIFILYVVYNQISNDDTFAQLNRIVFQFNDIFENENSSENIFRPIMTFSHFSERFIVSPIFGSGYGTSLLFPEEAQSTLYFHNDLFRTLASTGILGLYIILRLIKKFVIPLGFLTLLPFFLPGLTNTFFLNPQVFIFYWMMVGVFHSNIEKFK